MKIGIISDTHNNVENMEKALNRIRQEDVDTLIHCGDVTQAEVARLMVGFRVICTFGNLDYASGEIRDMLLMLNPTSYAGLVFSGLIEGVKVAVTHGHLSGKVEELVRSGEYAYVFKGHSHQHLDQDFGTTRLINPGALGGMRSEARQFCLLDLGSGQAEFIEI